MLHTIAPNIAPLDVERLRKEFHGAQPFPFIVIDGFLELEFARAVAAAYPSPDEAATKGRTFNAVNERGKTQITDTAHFAPAVRALHDALFSTAWLDALSRITGIPKLLPDSHLVGGGMHTMRSGAILDVHVDFNRIPDDALFRRLNILVFLNDRWDPRWGGELELWDEDVRACAHAFAPVLNRCVVFETSERSFHGVRQVRCPEPTARQSFAAYYYTREAPAHWNGTTHTTIFRPRPEEHWKRYVGMPAERLARAARAQLLLAKKRVGRLVKR
jgi:Rps23 Pro-64 3,4-dihydroxylase Tpa1-like proline 4-hydroxylase